jgi:hypothetical protein
VSAIARPQFDEASARGLTDEVKADAAALWSKLLDLYEGSAHTALGYSSWGAYCSTEFDIGESRAYQLIDAGRIRSTIVERGLPAPRSESVARELAPLRQQPERMGAAWSEAVGQHGEKPTAKQVRDTVRKLEDRLLPNAVRDKRGDTVNHHGVHALSASVQVKVHELYELVVLTPGVIGLLTPRDREEILRDLTIGDNVIAGIRKALTDTALRVVEGGAS